MSEQQFYNSTLFCDYFDHNRFDCGEPSLDPEDYEVDDGFIQVKDIKEDIQVIADQLFSQDPIDVKALQYALLSVCREVGVKIPKKEKLRMVVNG